MASITKDMLKQKDAINALCDIVLKPYVSQQNGKYTIVDAAGLEQTLQAASSLLQKRVREENAPVTDVVTDAFALVKAAFILHTNGDIVLYDEQLLAGLAMMSGNVSELATGEGKTYVQALAAYTYALAGKGVHVMSANQFLVERDAFENNAPVYEILGMTTGVVRPMTGDAIKDRFSKQLAYSADITYGTDKEIGFDYLRDSIAVEEKDLLLRGVPNAEGLTPQEIDEIKSKIYRGKYKTTAPRDDFFALVLDEADSLMLDNARVPLILSISNSKLSEKAAKISSEVLYAVDDIVTQIIAENVFQEKEKKYIVEDTNTANCIFSFEAVSRFFELASKHALLSRVDDSTLTKLFSCAERAHLMLQNGRDYMLKINESGAKTSDIILIDVNTGRLLENSRYNDGVHEMVTVKEKNALLNAYIADGVIRQVIKENEKRTKSDPAFFVLDSATRKPVFTEEGLQRCINLAKQNEKLAHVSVEYIKPLLINAQQAHMQLQKNVDYKVITNATGEVVNRVVLNREHVEDAHAFSTASKALELAVEIKESNQPNTVKILQAFEEFSAYRAKGYKVLPESTLQDLRNKSGVKSSESEDMADVLQMPYTKIHAVYKSFYQIQENENSFTAATINQQTFFSLYDYKSGMTGTAKTSESEFDEVYGMRVVPIPSHRPKQREDLPAKLFASKLEKYQQLVYDVKALHAQDIPILIGTESEEEAEYVARLLQNEGLRNVQTLTAKDHAKEKGIVSNAGAKGAITVTTSMGGRGTDIKLGGGDSYGTKESRKADKAYIESKGGLHVLLTQLSESKRIDDQLRGRSGRQGDKGTTILYVSAEDSIVKYLSDKEKDLLEKTAQMYAKQELAETEEGKQSVFKKFINKFSSENKDVLYRKALGLLQQAQTMVEGTNELARIQSSKIDRIQVENRKLTCDMRKKLLQISSGDQTENLSDVLYEMVLFCVNSMLQAELPQLQSAYHIKQADLLLNTHIFQSDENVVRNHWNRWVKENKQLTHGSASQQIETLAKCVAEQIKNTYTISTEDAPQVAAELLTLFDEGWMAFTTEFQNLQSQLYVEQQMGAQTDYFKELQSRVVYAYGQMLQNVSATLTNKYMQLAQTNALHL